MTRDELIQSFGGHSVKRIYAVAGQILDYLLEHDVKHMGNGAAGSVTKPLGKVVYGEEVSHHSVEMVLIRHALRLLEWEGFVRLDRETIQHEPGQARGQVGNKIVWLRVNT